MPVSTRFRLNADVLMPLPTFCGVDACDSANLKRCDHGSGQTLNDAITVWTDVICAIKQAQDKLQDSTSADCAHCSFVHRCAADPVLRAKLDFLQERNLHGILLSWVVEGVRERLTCHAVPQFWRLFCHVHSTKHGPLSSGLQRAYQASFFTAVGAMSRCE
jgi:hypothetical protein